MTKRKRLKEGDLFTIPISESKVGLGQIIYLNKYGFNLYVIIFKETFDMSPDPDNLNLEFLTPFLIGGTMDARIYHGMWNVIGNKKIDVNKIIKPKFILGQDTKLLVSFEGNTIREATSDDLKLYDYKSSRAPIAFEDLLKSEITGSNRPVDSEKIIYEYSKLRQ